MNRKEQILWLILITGVVLLACGPAATPTPEANLEATMAAAIAQTKAAQQPAAPAQPEPAQADVQATVDAQVRLTVAAQQGEEVQQEALALATEIAEFTAEDAQDADSAEPPPAPAADGSNSGEAAMAALVEDLYNSRRLSVKEGEYIPLEDFNNAVYKNQTHEWWRAGESASDFVLRAKAGWRGSSQASASGCGFMYSGLALDDYHITILSTEGIVHTYRSRGGKVIEMKGGEYSKSLGISAGEAEIMLIVDDKKMSFYVNGEQVVQFSDSYINSGNIGYAINNFSPNGINCQLTEVEMWKIY